jgi:2-oxoisovalerate dehydrogenase E1 component
LLLTENSKIILCRGIGPQNIKACFSFLDAPVDVLGALNLPAVPMNIALESNHVTNADKVLPKG